MDSLQQSDKNTLNSLREQITATLPRLCGRVRKLRTDKGFGFIAGDDGVDYFVHWSAVKRSSTRDLKEMVVRDRVEFSPIQPPNKKVDGKEVEVGPRAIEVIFIPEE